MDLDAQGYELNPFGTGRTEQGNQDAFVDLVGGTARADQLSRISQNSYPSGANNMDPYYRTREQNFRRKALAEGFIKAQINAFLAL